MAQWLRSNHRGLATYKSFQQKLLDAAVEHRDHYVVFYLLATIIERFVEVQEDTPLTFDTMDRARKRLVAISNKIARFDAMSCEDRLELLNEIAATDLS